MSDERQPGGDDRGISAAEYALHLLDPLQRAAFESRLETDGALRGELAFWTDALAPLTDAIEPVTPPPGLRARIGSAISVGPRRGGVAVQPKRLLDRARLLWQMLFGAGIAVALGVALFALLPRTVLTPVPGYVAEIQSEGGALHMTASYDAARGEITLTRLAGAPPPGRVLELWAIPAGADVPESLGVVPEGDNVTLVVADAMREKLPGATLAVSDEPPGGSPTGAPTGSVLGAGALSET